jgi:hypothetical protein
MKPITYEQGRGYILDGNDYILSYFTESKKIHYCGTHTGEIVGNSLTVELHDTIEQIILRVKELKLILTMEDVKEIMDRANHKNVVLSEVITYVNSINE